MTFIKKPFVSKKAPPNRIGYKRDKKTNISYKEGKRHNKLEEWFPVESEEEENNELSNFMEKKRR